MSHIFISYSKKNRDYASALANKLRDAGFDVWIDDRINYGDEWWEKIVEAIRECSAFLVIMSPDSDTSKWVKREVRLADHLSKPMFPALLEGDLINSETWTLFIGTQYVDVRGGLLPNDDFFTWLRTVVQPKNRERGNDLTLSPSSPRSVAISNSAVTKRAAPAARTKDARQFPLIIKPEWVGKIIPEPFEWCVVPAGTFGLAPTRESADYVSGLGAAGRVEEAFKIARYPITNLQFQVFLDASDGWREAQWWDYSESARAWRDQNTQSRSPRYGMCGDCPREEVTWYEAIAFTRWLTSKTGEQITLPTDAQWERSLRGDSGWIFPWGNDWDATKCNFVESNIGSISPVMKYPDGTSPFGALDMCGNVLEWCLTDFNTGDRSIIGSNSRVLRGGSFEWSYEQFLSSDRDHYRPENCNHVIGFRCATLGELR